MLENKYYRIAINLSVLVIIIWVAVENYREYEPQLSNVFSLKSPPDIYDLKQAEIIKNIPTSMELNKIYPAEIKIKFTDSVLNFNHKYKPNVQKSLLSSVANVELRGKLFEISNINLNEQQLIDYNNYSIWKWEIKPIKAGKNNIYVSLSSKLEDSNIFFQRDNVVETVTINVQDPSLNRVQRFLYNNWKWLISIIIIPLILWLRKQILKKITGRKRNKIGYH